LKHYATKSPIEIQKHGDVCYKELNKKRSALNVDLKSALSKSFIKKKDKGDAKSAELDQIKEEASKLSNSPSKTSPQDIDQVGKLPRLAEMSCKWVCCSHSFSFFKSWNRP
jgi:hypothetical protein